MGGWGGDGGRAHVRYMYMYVYVYVHVYVCVHWVCLCVLICTKTSLFVLNSLVTFVKKGSRDRTRNFGGCPALHQMLGFVGSVPCGAPLGMDCTAV